MVVDLHEVTDWVAYWVLFWSFVNIALPPREIFKDASPGAQKRYNTILMLVQYYGSLNVRQLTVKMYDAVNTQPPAAAPHQLENALLDAQISGEKTVESIAKAQDSMPPGDK